MENHVTRAVCAVISDRGELQVIKWRFCLSKKVSRGLLEGYIRTTLTKVRYQNSQVVFCGEFEFEESVIEVTDSQFDYYTDYVLKVNR
jgi:hypothetical protein